MFSYISEGLTINTMTIRIRTFLISLILSSTLFACKKDKTECCNCPPGWAGGIGDEFEICDDTPYSGEENPNDFEYEWENLAHQLNAIFGDNTFTSWTSLRNELENSGGCECGNQ